MLIIFLITTSGIGMDWIVSQILIDLYPLRNDDGDVIKANANKHINKFESRPATAYFRTDIQTHLG